MKKLITFTILTIPTIAFAASEGHALDWKGLGWRVFIFVIFVALMYKILKKPIMNAIVNRSIMIEKALNEAFLAKAEAEKQVIFYQEKMKELEKELITMKEDAHKLAEKERLLMIADAEKSAVMMKEAAKRMIITETERAKNELRTEVARLVFEEAEKRIAKDADSANSKEIAEQYIKRIGANI